MGMGMVRPGGILKEEMPDLVMDECRRAKILFIDLALRASKSWRKYVINKYTQPQQFSFMVNCQDQTCEGRQVLNDR